MSAPDTQYALAADRDRFLSALDGDDFSVTTRLAAHLTTCGNPLPSSTCRELGLPVGSSYATAARQVISNNGRMPVKVPQAAEAAPESQATQGPGADGACSAPGGKVTMT
jgi:hypothetical protein